MVVLEAFLSALFEILLNKLVADPLLEYARRLKVDRAVLQGWTNTLLHLQAVLHDAEQRQIRDEAVKRWLDDLKALAYDIEDVLDEFEAEAKGPSLVQGPQTSSSSGGGKVWNLIPLFILARITQELEAIVKRKSYLRLSESVGGVASVTDQQRLTTFLVDEVEVYGRDGDKEKIIELLLSDELATADKVQVIPIVGMGGFHCRVWVCVSDQFDLIGITKSILESVSGHSSHSENLSLLQDSLQKELNGKRFSLYWMIYGMRTPISEYLTSSTQSWSTRQRNHSNHCNEQVASIMRTASSYPLSELSDEHCWSLFSHRAFENITPDAIKNLEPIGRKIIQKCKGLPLAAKTLGGLLRSEQDEKAWKEMMNDEIWDLPTEQSNILPALHLSYHYLPTKVKQCFAYCSIFPKDYEYQKEELILLWDGEKCFRNLLSRSFFQQSSQIKSWFVMHDLIHDLAQFVSREFCFRLEVETKNFSKRARHLSYDREKFDVDKLRTFLPLGWVRGYLADKVLRDLLPKFRCLRVLSLSGYNITHLPADLFQNLKHLRYLNLSSTNIRNLPKSIGMLCNLQSLMLSDCHGITELPPEIENLIHLHHLDISGTKLEGMPTGINKLKDLRRLTTFVVGKHSGARITELQDLSHLRGALSILNLQNVVNATDALKANLKKKEDLDDLVFAWDSNVSDNVSENQTRVLENLQPHTKVKRLRIRQYYGTKFPKWLGDPSFMNLVFLRLGHCKNCLSLPPLGQLQSLKDLWIVKMDGVQNVGADFYGNNDCDSSSIKPFGSLEILRFEEMLEWEEWVCRGVEFPCLKELYIKKCPKLKKVGVELYGNSYCSSTSIKPFGSLEILRFEKMLEWEEWVSEKVGVELYGNSYCSSTSIKPFGSLEILRFEEMLEWEEWVCRGVEFPCLKELYIKKSAGVLSSNGSSIRQLELQKCDDVVVRSAGSLTSLAYLTISYVCKIPDELGQLNSLVHLCVYSCPELKEIPPILHSLTSLEDLNIFDCESLASFPEMALPPMLERLEIRGCPTLESLPEGMMQNNTTLQLLEIGACGSLRSLPRGIDSLKTLAIDGINSLKTLLIEWCEKLELSLAEDMTHNHYASLTTLYIGISCDSLTSFPLAFFTKLETLDIWGCTNLESLYIPDGFHHVDLTSLQSLYIYYCANLVSFPQGGLPTPDLRSLLISSSKKLRSLPQGMHTSLHPFNICIYLIVQKLIHFQGVCPLIYLPSHLELQQNLKIESFPEEQFLPPLSSLTIGAFPNLKSLDNKGFSISPS
ncbi:hypothetical protein AAG906_021858 [Vitis piasezkii]